LRQEDRKFVGKGICLKELTGFFLLAKPAAWFPRQRLMINIEVGRSDSNPYAS
jgi:hypothetical protein